MFSKVFPEITRSCSFVGTSIFVGYIIGKSKQYYKKETEDFFPCDRSSQQKETGLSMNRIKKAEDEAIEKGFISKKVTGYPSQLFYSVDYKKLDNTEQIDLQGANLDRPTGGKSRSTYRGQIKNDLQGANLDRPTGGKSLLYVDKETNKKVDDDPIADLDKIFDQIEEIYPRENSKPAVFEEARVLFRTKFQKKRKEQGYTNEDVLQAIQMYAREIKKSPNSKPYGILKFLGLKSFKDDPLVDYYVGYIKTAQKIREEKQPLNAIDELFHEKLKKAFGRDYAMVSSIHIVEFKEENFVFNDELNIDFLEKFGISTVKLFDDVLRQLKEELT